MLMQPSQARAAGNAADDIAGIAARHVRVACTCSGLAACLHHGFSAPTVERLLGLGESGAAVPFQIADGADRPRPRPQLPAVF